MADIETKIITTLFNLFKQTKSIKRVVKGENLKRAGFKEALNWLQSETPWISITPDLMLFYEDYSVRTDEPIIVAIETKYLKTETKGKWREVFRQIGQPLRNLIFGFNSVVLWHLFAAGIDDEKIKKFTDICEEVITKLNLPIVYLATKITNDELRIYKPWDIKSQNIDYIASSIKEMCSKKINPLLYDQEVIKRRRAIKTALNIP